MLFILEPLMTDVISLLFVTILDAVFCAYYLLHIKEQH